MNTQNQNLTKRQAQSIKTKKKICSVAMELIDKKGFDNTTIEDITKKANVSIGAFYHYYKSKDDIYFDLYKKADEYFESEVFSHLTEENSLDQIVSFFMYYAKYNNFRGLDAMTQLYNTKNKLFIGKGRYMRTLLENIITNGQAKNEIITDMSPEAMADYLFIIGRGITFDWCLHEAAYDLEEMMVKNMKRLIVIFKKI